MFKEIVQKGNDKSLKNVIEEWKSGEMEDSKKYLLRVDDSIYAYNIRGLKAQYHGTNCRALVLLDQSAYERLNLLDEKYQKLYVASIVHDIRTPLNGITGMLDMLETYDKGEEETLYLSVAKRTCKLLLYLTYDITDYSQLEANKFKANNEKIKIRDLLEETMQLLSFSFEQKKLEHISEVSDLVPVYLFVDKNRYHQIILNLLGNALKFTFQGQIRVAVDYDRVNDILLTSVRDTGIGIKEEEIPHLFKLFGKLESSQAVNPQGVGFGLAICKKLAESLGGHISVSSRYGMGSTFTFGIKGNISLINTTTQSRVVSRVMSGNFPSNVSSLIPPGDIEDKIKKYKFSYFNPFQTPREGPVLVVFKSNFFRQKELNCWRKKRILISK